ncbi:hypothetical protein CYMTET_10175 [Cymbomonas tetramitiformis]|uniref:Uncharacterized protein n=1 Tax=Cymbomonas tetramitiformis TaxID=36881 RepID=A0AAE0GPM3_9CHLO|nr:hypothetical protein CYMTET_10175 [Cymbomonas tetramitiformis]
MEDTFQSYGNAGDFVEEPPRSRDRREGSRSKYPRYDSGRSDTYDEDPDPSYSEGYQERGSKRSSGKEFYETRRDRLLMWLDTPSNRSSQFVARLVLSFVVAPIAISSICRVTIINPVLQTKWDAGWFDLTTSQQEAVADRVERVRQRIEYTSLMGRAPTLSGEEFLDQLRQEGQRLEQTEMQHNKTSLSNALSDSLCGAIVAGTLITNRRRVNLVRTWLGDWCLDLPSSTQAFALLLVTDILVGYHSSEGWITVVDNILGHYGVHPDESFTSIFVAVVPVSLDVVFKYWVFNSLRKLSPSTQIILEQIDKG